MAVLRSQCVRRTSSLPCCLVKPPRTSSPSSSSSSSESRTCALKEADWNIFAKVRRSAVADPFFTGCHKHVTRHLFSWQPSEIVRLGRAFARSGSADAEQLLRRLLWRLDRVLPHLAADELVRFLEVYAARGVREHDPKRPDLFKAAAPRLIELAEEGKVSTANIGKIATMYRQLNIREEELFTALAEQLASILDTEARRRASRQRSSASTSIAVRKHRAVVASPSTTAAMSLLMACGRLNLVTGFEQQLLELIGPAVRAADDLRYMAALAQLAVKFGFGDHPEVEAIWMKVHGSLEETALAGKALPQSSQSPRWATQAVLGQLVLAVIFDERACALRDTALVSAVGAVHHAFSQSTGALDERLTRQLQVAELACRLERPAALQMLEQSQLLPFLSSLKEVGVAELPLTKCSSQQHLQVSGALRQLGVDHNLEEKVAPYIADVRINKRETLIEIDGPLHFIGQTSKYDLKSSLKHRLLTKLGWKVHHIAWYDWPRQHQSRLNFVARLLRSRPPEVNMREYQQPRLLPLPEPSKRDEDAVVK